MSGYYLAELIITSGPDAGRRRHVQFTVRAPDASPTAILVVVPVNTIQAYNKWGGKSLYNSGSIGPRANRVSFDRPTNPQDLSSDLFRHEYHLIRFLEREGYDVSYATNVDVHRDPSQLLDHSMVMTAGHDEYWTKEMRDGFEVARDAGVHLSFMARTPPTGRFATRTTSARSSGTRTTRTRTTIPSWRRSCFATSRTRVPSAS